MNFNQVGPFTGVEFDAQRQVCVGGAVRHFRIVAYEAYNACGLIGPEQNGVAILDEDHKQVVCDQLWQADSGYFGLAKDVIAKAKALSETLDADFIRTVGASPRLRSPGWLKGEY